jgi:5-oxoprolinase (ATP-hydrolysing) subunit C
VTAAARPVLEVLRAGFVTVQDLGRAGWARLGVGANGAADQRSARIANVLVGNVSGAPLIEAVGSGLTVRALRPVLLAVTGAVDVVHSSRGDLPVYEPVVLAAGETLSVDPGPVGLRWYLAVRGAIAADRVLDSVAFDSFLGIGRMLRSGDTVDAVSTFVGVDHPVLRIPVFRLGAPRPLLRAEHSVLVTAGPDAADFPDLERLFGEPYQVSAASDHVGVRLLGAAPVRTGRREILSRGVPIGAVEVPSGGGVIALLRGRFVTAGYPIPAVATTRGLDTLGQLKPGETVRFRLVRTQDAVRDARADAAVLDELAERVDRAFRAVGIEG